MLVLLFHNSDKLKHFSYLCLHSTIHVEIVLRLFTVFERILELLLNFFTHCAKLFALIDFRQLLWEDMNSRLFQHTCRCLDFMAINLMFLWKSWNDKLISWTFDEKVLINFLWRKNLRLNDFSVWESEQYFIATKEIILNHLEMWNEWIE